MRARLAVALMLFQLPVVSAQSPALTGAWAVEAKAAQVQTDEGVNWNMGPVSGTLTLEQKGDAVTGTWQGALPGPWKVTGKAEKGSFELQTEVRDLPAERDGQKTTVARSWIFRGSVDGDKLSGMLMLSGGERNPPGRPFAGARKK